MPTATAARRVHRIEIRRQNPADDPRARLLLHDAQALGICPSTARVSRIYLIEGAFDDQEIQRIARELLADPILESPAFEAHDPTDARVIEVHPLPGVMDPAAQSVREAIADLTGHRCEVVTAWRYELGGLTRDEADRLARRLLANPVIHAIHERAYSPTELPKGHDRRVEVRRVPIRDLDDEQLARLSREAHLFLSLDEMRAIRDHYRARDEDPREIELETLAQTWSEHCVHKTLKSTVRYTCPDDDIAWPGRPGVRIEPDGSIVIENLLRSTVAAATARLIDDGIDWTLSVFVDNAGVIAFDEHHAVCVKVETHNHPSAIEPYGGAATGIGGCIRDIIGTGLAARPIASTDVFCVAFPDAFAPPESEPTDSAEALPPGCLHPRRILTNVVAGVRDYGNRMGIPTLSGAVDFDDRYIANPLVFCGCVGIMPRDRIRGQARPGDHIIALGGRTGRDGIHGATFSSAELTDTHADEFSHAVQIGNPIEEKRLLDAILRARDEHEEPLFTAITDCGAGGFSSAVGEMGEHLGAEVHLDRAPLKYAGLTSTEIWISEAQERMILAVPERHLDALHAICREERVEMADLGHFGTPDAELILYDHDTEVGRMRMDFLHGAIPMPTRDATWAPSPVTVPSDTSEHAPDARTALLNLLAHPAVCSKHWIIRQYDHEVQGNTVVKPLMGAGAIGPTDAGVIEPVPSSGRGLAIACGLQTRAGDPSRAGDPYQMALCAIDECVRNLVCSGADPRRIAILDNFCWPSCNDPAHMGALVRACVGCYDGALAYRTPFISGKDSLNNQFTLPATDDQPARTIAIPYTLLITGVGIIEDLTRCVTSDLKKAGSLVCLIEPPAPPTLAQSLYADLFARDPHAHPQRADLTAGPHLAHAMARLIRSGMVRSCHDVSDGGLLCALSEMLIGAWSTREPLGMELDAPDTDAAWAFGEGPSRYLVEIDAHHLDDLRATVAEACESARISVIGRTGPSDRLTCPALNLDVPVPTLIEAWRGTLDW